jgi:hypothetical protein
VFLARLLLSIPPRTPDRARLALTALDRLHDDASSTLIMTKTGTITTSVHPDDRDLYRALRRYAEARAAEAAPSANPGAPGGDK